MMIKSNCVSAIGVLWKVPLCVPTPHAPVNQSHAGFAVQICIFVLASFYPLDKLPPPTK